MLFQQVRGSSLMRQVKLKSIKRFKLINLISIEELQCWYPFRGECKADFHVNLLRQFLHSKSPFWSKKSWILTGKGQPNWHMNIAWNSECFRLRINLSEDINHRSIRIIDRHQSSIFPRLINHPEKINQSINPKKSIKSRRLPVRSRWFCDLKCLLWLIFRFEVYSLFNQ